MVAYLDSSALVKLIGIEAETAALRRELTNWPDRVSSLLASVEVARAARRRGGSAAQIAANVLAGLDLLAIDPIPTATSIGGPLLRSLDAIHLATAQNIAADVGADHVRPPDDQRGAGPRTARNLALVARPT